MKKGNSNPAVKLLTNNMKDGILPLNNEPWNTLKEKHPKSENINDVLLRGVPKRVYQIMFVGINEEISCHQNKRRIWTFKNGRR